MLTVELIGVVYKLFKCLGRTSDEMPQRKQLTEIEVRRVCFLCGTSMSVCHIAKEIRRFKTAVENIIKRGTDVSVQKRSGAK